MINEAVVFKCKVLSQNFPGGEENYEKLQLR
jgi:hypothetical protein